MDLTKLFKNKVEDKGNRWSRGLSLYDGEVTNFNKACGDLSEVSSVQIKEDSDKTEIEHFEMPEEP